MDFANDSQTPSNTHLTEAESLLREYIRLQSTKWVAKEMPSLLITHPTLSRAFKIQDGVSDNDTKLSFSIKKFLTLQAMNKIAITTFNW